MSLARCAAFLLATAAIAHAEPPGADAELEDCEGLPARGLRLRAAPVGEDAVHVVARSGQRYLVFAQGRDGCEVYPIGRAAARVTGRFGAGNKAFALRGPRCGGGDCPVAVAVRGKDETPLLALRAEADCDVSVELRLITLFPDRDTFELVCRNSAGAGWSERRLIFDAGEDTLITLYSLDTGSYIAPTLEERRAGEGASCPVGSLRVEKTGARPILRAADPAWGTLLNGKGTVPARQLGYDPKRHEFVPTGAPDLPLRVDARAACRRR